MRGTASVYVLPWVPFDGEKATSSDLSDDCIISAKMLAGPAPTTPTLTFGVPASLRTPTCKDNVIHLLQFVPWKRRRMNNQKNRMILT